MDHEASESVKGELNMEMSIKTEVETAATYTLHIDSDVNLNHLKQESGLVQTVKREPALLVKEEILGDSSQDRQLSDKETPPQQLYECDKCPKVYKSYACFNVHKKYVHSIEIHKLAQSNKRLKYASLNNDVHSAHSNDQHECDICKKVCKSRHDLNTHYSMIHGPRSAAAGNEQQCVQGTTTLANNDRVNKGCSTSPSDLINAKHELEDIDIGPTVLQHMDIHYPINKPIMSAAIRENTIADDGNKAMPCSRVKKESLEDNLRASCKHAVQKLTEDDYDDAYFKFCLRQQMNLEQQGFMCHRTIHKSNLLSAKNKVTKRNSSKIFIMTSSIVTSNQNRDEKTRTKQKLNNGDKGYSSKATKYVQSLKVTKQMRVHTAEKRFQCDTCDARIARRRDLIEHLRIHTSEKPYRCGTCDARFNHRCALAAHMRVHTGEKPYRCRTCDARFTQRGALVAHLRVHTGEKPYRCGTCDARFTQRGALTIHMRGHTGEKPYLCDTCDARFKQRGTLTYHMRGHTGEKPFQCDTCDARFKHRSALTVHMRVHTGEKPYLCDTCDERFKQHSALTYHMRGHTGEKPYLCDTCDARFKQHSALTYHMRGHTGEKPYQCDTCDARFKYSRALTVHMRVH